ncbi:integral membrane protein GPR137C isoform X2 [Ictalurus punctatus]|uniref:Integral membrane protein GPR137C isoform X2 n=1 Tax=Ictalurus punctatus TaxID=7998 RepID=A0A9F7RNU3_ICTPU|nr:integral membrane protein GPR137C isoform X2 [Ictalurus punctatus]
MRRRRMMMKALCWTWRSRPCTRSCTLYSSSSSTRSSGSSCTTATSASATGVCSSSCVCSGRPSGPLSSPSTSTTWPRRASCSRCPSGSSTVSPCACSSAPSASSTSTSHRMPLRLAFLFISVFFLAVNITCSLMVLTQKNMEASNAKHIILARVLINDSLFVLCAISLATCICKLAKMSSANVYLESKGTSVRQATATGAAVVLLYTSRVCYNLAIVAVSPKDRATPFNYGWYSFSDQDDVEKISGKAYMVFGIVLFFWEFVPTTLLVVFFRVQRPNQNLAPGGMIHSHSFNSRAYFFDNPRRYDSDDDLSRSLSSRSERGSSTMSSSSQLGASWYGSLQKTGSFTFTAPQTSTAPLLLSYGSIQTSQHHNYYSTPQDYYSTPQN